MVGHYWLRNPKLSPNSFLRLQIENTLEAICSFADDIIHAKATYDKLLSEAPKFKLITPSILSDRLRINEPLARKVIKDLMARGAIRMVSAHASQHQGDNIMT
ncbi:hypothetical protein M8C21_002186 [Ambrosia artemisiifolia]|uniref:40S ribosomal protein S25 n=1 Tax=Ambrosia artemisiifolia TaxID=4212 RepID=A0AAD5G5V6_AMBAR|nr:hypothetical protein M8C21_002186 [Ambrosia artemisiifolia]